MTKNDFNEQLESCQKHLNNEEKSLATVVKSAGCSGFFVVFRQLGKYVRRSTR